MQGFMKKVELIDIIIYRVEKGIDDLKQHLIKMQDWIIKTKFKNINSVILPDFSDKIEFITDSFTQKCNRILRSLFQNTF